MSGSTWPNLVAGAKAKASEVEAKFDWMEGDFLPFTGGVKTDATYDLGSSSFRWVDGWFSGRVYVGSGAEGTPAFTGWNDQNTGAWFPAADTWAISTAGSERTRITSAGYFGVGRTPAFFVHFNKDDNSEVQYRFGNNQATTTSHCRFKLIANALGGDPVMEWADNIGGAGQAYQMGIDNSNSDVWELVNGTTFGTNVLIRGDSSLNINKPNQPSFLAYLSSTLSDVTGDGTFITVQFDTEVYDQNSDYTPNTFTAPVDGRYLFCGQVSLNDLNAAAAYVAHLYLTTSNRTYHQYFEVGTGSLNSDEFSFNISQVVDMDALDQCTIECMVAGGAKSVDVTHDGIRWKTVFSGSLIN